MLLTLILLGFARRLYRLAFQSLGHDEGFRELRLWMGLAGEGVVTD